jgi:hypothetical protein
MVPGVLDPDSSPQAFRRVGGRSRSLNNMQNRYSYVTTGAITGFDGEAVGLKPPSHDSESHGATHRVSL